MYPDWTKHLKDPEDKAKFERDVWGSKRILDHIRGLLQLKDRSLEASERSISSFDQPNWAYKQAFNNGYKAALMYLITLIDLDQQTPKEIK